MKTLSFLLPACLWLLVSQIVTATPYTVAVDLSGYTNSASVSGDATILTAAHANVSDILVIGRSDGLVAFLNAVTLVPIYNSTSSFRQHTKAVRKLQVANFNGVEYAITAGIDYKLIIWQVSTASVLASRNLDSSMLYDVCWNGANIYVVSNAGYLYKLSLPTGATVSSVNVGQASYSVSCNAGEVAVGSANGKISIYNAITLALRTSFMTPTTYPTAIFNVPSAKVVYTSSDVDQRFQITSENGTTVNTFWGASPRTTGVSPSLDPTKIWFAGDGKAVRFDTTTNLFTNTIDFAMTASYSGPSVFAVTERLRPNLTIYGAMSSSIYVFNATVPDNAMGIIPYTLRNTGTTLSTHPSSPDLACYNGDAQSLVNGTSIFNVTSRTWLGDVTHSSATASSWSCDIANNNVFYFGMTNGVVVKQANGTFNFLSVTSQNGVNIRGLESLSPDTSTLYTFGAEKLTVYDTASLSVLGTIASTSDVVGAVAPIQTAGMSKPNAAMYWTNGTLVLLGYPAQPIASQTLLNASFGVWIDMVTSGDRLIVCYTNVIAIVPTTSPSAFLQPVIIPANHTGALTSCTADATSGIWYTAGADQLIKQRDRDGRVMQVFTGLTGRAMSMAVSRGQLVTSGIERLIKLWPAYVALPSAVSTTTPTSPSSSTAPQASTGTVEAGESNTGPSMFIIAGAAAGGAVLIGASSFGYWLTRRRQRLDAEKDQIKQIYDAYRPQSIGISKASSLVDMPHGHTTILSATTIKTFTGTHVYDYFGNLNTATEERAIAGVASMTNLQPDMTTSTHTNMTTNMTQGITALSGHLMPN